MDQITQKIYEDIRTLASFEPTALSEGGLTYPEVRDMLVFTRQLKTRLEVLWALPLDMPRPPEVMTDEIVPRVAESATGMPIIH